MKECPNVESLRAQEEPAECSHLDQLPLEDCFGLKSVHCFLPSMAKLQIAFCDELESFPGVGLPAFPLVGLSFKLESLMIRCCKKILATCKQWDLQDSLLFQALISVDMKKWNPSPKKVCSCPPDLTLLESFFFKI
jgi:hypothetical protein